MILNKKNPNIESQLFTSELEKFRPYQTRLAGLAHKQQELLSEVVRSFKGLLQEQAGSKEQADIEAAQQQVDALVTTVVFTENSRSRGFVTYILYN